MYPSSEAVDQVIIVRGIPVYWGVETQARDRSFLTRATLDEVLPPFRESRRAVRIRISPWHWLHVGVFAYKTEVTPWGLEALPERIGRWGEETEANDLLGILETSLMNATSRMDQYHKAPADQREAHLSFQESHLEVALEANRAIQRRVVNVSKI